MTDARIVLTTLPGSDAAASLARTLIQERLAACANIIPAVRSIYRWQGKVQDENEVLVVFKTRAAQLDRLRARLLELHPYAVPEWLAFSVDEGHVAYLDWIAAETG